MNLSQDTFKPDYLSDAFHWQGHIPFIQYLIKNLRPKTYVELGVWKGDSFCAVCESVKHFQLPAICYGIDTWEGDIHTSHYSEEVYKNLDSYIAQSYPDITSLLRMTFDDAVDQFEGKSIDLLHIDGTHTYDAVKHDFEKWLPKMSGCGIVLFHDIAVKDAGFGAWKIWNELNSKYPSFEFEHSYGLGVLLVGKLDNDHPLQELFDASLGKKLLIKSQFQEAASKFVNPDSGKISHSAYHREDPSVKAIAFYLPQFHPTQENDTWWGKGFTEWTNVVRAKPRFDGHYQPHLPSDLGFYDLRVPETRQQQADLARRYGIYGFCYYHYWFSSKRLLNLPLDEILRRKEPNLPFCLMWPNESWTRKWDGADQAVLVEQSFSHADDLNHIRWLIKTVFVDPRYIRVDGKPLFIIYRPQKMPSALETTNLWREEAKKSGLPGLYLCKAETFGDFSDPRNMGFDAAVDFPPHTLGSLPFPRLYNIKSDFADDLVYDYDDFAEKSLGRSEPTYPRFLSAFPGWDNSARRTALPAIIFHNSTPNRYEEWLKEIIKKTRASSSIPEPIVFINAWNEWAEGCHLEPDERHGLAFLEATQRALYNMPPHPSQVQKEHKSLLASIHREPAPLHHQKIAKLQEQLAERDQLIATLVKRKFS